MKALIFFWNLWLWALLVCFWCITLVCVTTNSIDTMASLLVICILFVSAINKYTQAISSNNPKWPSSWHLGIIAFIVLKLWNLSTTNSVTYACLITTAILSLVTAVLTLIKHCTACKLQLEHGMLCTSMFAVLMTNMLVHMSNTWQSSWIFFPISFILSLPFLYAFATVKTGNIKLVSSVSFICAGLVMGYPVFSCETHTCTATAVGLSLSSIYLGFTGIISTLHNVWTPPKRGMLTFLLLLGGVLTTQTLTTELLAITSNYNGTMNPSTTGNIKGHEILLLVCLIFLWCLYVWQSFNKASLVTGILHLIAAWSHTGGCAQLVMLLPSGLTRGILTMIICISTLFSTLQGLLVFYLYKETKVVAVNSYRRRRRRIYTRDQNLHHNDNHVGNNVISPPPLPPFFRQPVRLSSHVTDRGRGSQPLNEVELQEVNRDPPSVFGYASILVSGAEESREPSPQPDQSGMSILRVDGGSAFRIDTAQAATQPTDDLYEEVFFTRN
uniref:Latent signal transducing membrane protein n=1 Tax=Human herpesvirus 8 TaxID=37296 RepID=A0A386ATT0_HHV8|nr:latent signal transducing membrane protein [Human gammaherpesvirus 8]